MLKNRLEELLEELLELRQNGVAGALSDVVTYKGQDFRVSVDTMEDEE